MKWRIAASWPKSLDVGYGGVETFCRIVGEMTDQKFSIQPFAAGEIVPALQVLDAVGNGTIEAGHTASYYYVGKDPTFAFGTQLPFYLNTRQNMAWMLQGGGLQLMNEFYKKHNVRKFIMGTTGCQMGGFFRKEINKPDDWKGLKFRIGGFAGQVLRKLGAVPQQIAGGDIYPSLEKGTIDAAEWVGPYDDEKQGFHKVAPYYYFPGWWEGGPLITLFVNLQKFEALPKAYKTAIEAASTVAHNEIIAKYDDRNPQALKRLSQAGTKFRVFPTEVLDACHKAATELYQETSDKNADFKKIYEAVKSYWADQALWWQVAEYSMDSYMVAMRRKS
jgi:TRAP-type mannitol/chloroaromatic compound transport system substrate-binding protein